MSLEQVMQAVREHRRFLVTTHMSPEADAIGSSLGLAHFLRQMGKQCNVVIHDPLPRTLRFLPYQDILRQQTSLSKWPEVFFVLDCGDLERTGLFGKGDALRSCLINIDHHITNKQFGQINWVDVEAAATGELIYELVEALGLSCSREAALCLYTAIVSDTGFFAYSNTRPKTFRSAASLLEQGVDPWAVAQRLHEMTPERMHLLSELLNSMERSRDGRLAWITATRQLFEKTSTSSEDTEDLIRYPRSLRGVEIAILFLEVDADTCKISLRSKNKVDVAKLAQRFGGGGHMKAAGCTVNGSLTEVKQQILAAAEEAIRNGC
jgi:bifunctional oligoribonuclease and PAP phosphatase NrnA